MKRFSDLFNGVKGRNRRLAVAHPYGGEVIRALEEARREGIARSLLVGDREKIDASFEEAEVSQDDYEIIHAPGEWEGALKSASLVASGEADALMKGKLPTALFLKAALDEEKGLRTGSLLSHIVLMEAAKIGRLIMITDSGMVLSPTLQDKVMIIGNAVEYASRLGWSNPKIAAVAHVETVSPKSQATLDAALLAGMSRRGQIKGCIVDGPFGLDNALSEEAAAVKGISSPVAGNADIILVPDVLSGNLMAKAMMYTADCAFGGLVVGGKAPIIMLSRADDAATKLNSIVMGLL
ncbi:MAG TPA: bifunctional enoyl-CoA hydratase/phosphate acetyltransferase [Candidatus Mcinerneyibacteriales bacterium]|nr:bifunctional enoyl-CoA hydratase/phosphate acetyltransferase [Candidatus Mcinerneyibacteriales bacterium]